MFSKPLASRMDTAPMVKQAKMMRGAPITGGMGAINFASFLPQNNAAALPALAGQGAPLPGGRDGSLSPEAFVAQRSLRFKQIHAAATLTGNTEGATRKSEAGQQGTGLPLNKQDLSRIALRGEKTENADTKAAPATGRSRKTQKHRTKETLHDTAHILRQKYGGSTAVGHLSARFESGKEGAAAIGYDGHGGTSYGKYQISSRAEIGRAHV